MKSLVLAASALMIAGFSQPSFAEDRGAMAKIRFAGTMEWHARCEAQKMKGDTTSHVRRSKSSSSIKSIEMMRIVSGECQIALGEGASLMISFEGRGGLDCPFTNADQNCTVKFQNAGRTSFTFARPQAFASNK